MTRPSTADRRCAQPPWLGGGNTSIRDWSGEASSRGRQHLQARSEWSFIVDARSRLSALFVFCARETMKGGPWN